MDHVVVVFQSTTKVPVKGESGNTNTVKGPTEMTGLHRSKEILRINTRT